MNEVKFLAECPFLFHIVDMKLATEGEGIKSSSLVECYKNATRLAMQRVHEQIAARWASMDATNNSRLSVELQNYQKEVYRRTCD